MNKQLRILLVGSGNIGRRYLEGLAKLKFETKVQILDISKDSLLLAKNFFLSLENQGFLSVSFNDSVEDIEGTFDIAIISTTAKNRVEIIQNIKQKFEIRSWIIEKVIVQSLDELRKMERMFINNKKVWVNHPRRIMKWHTEIKKTFLNNIDIKNPIKVKIQGIEWGLACNALHFIDLVSWWTDDVIKDIDISGLNNWSKSKRKGFEEVYGIMKINFIKNSTLELVCYPGKLSTHSIEINTLKSFINIDEEKGKAYLSDGNYLSGKVDNLSDIVPEVICKIYRDFNCDLTTLAQSISQHEKFLESLMQHRRLTLKEESILIPIT